MKRTISLLLTLVLMLPLFIGCNNSSDTEKEEPKDDTLIENSASDFEYTIHGEEDKVIMIDKYIGTSENVVIPAYINDAPVVTIGAISFTSNDIVKTVHIPSTVKSILNSAFMNCQKLTSITFSDNIVLIENNAFSHCTSLQEIKLPKKLEQIGSSAFEGCTSLKSAWIPKSLNSWGMSVFLGNSSLESITFEEGIENIGAYYCFAGCNSLKTLTFPKGVKKINGPLFYVLKDLSEIVFLGDAPEIVGNDIFGVTKDTFTIYYDKNTSGWDTTPLAEYKLAITD